MAILKFISYILNYTSCTVNISNDFIFTIKSVRFVLKCFHKSPDRGTFGDFAKKYLQDIKRDSLMTKEKIFNEEHGINYCDYKFYINFSYKF